MSDISEKEKSESEALQNSKKMRVRKSRKSIKPKNKYFFLIILGIAIATILSVVVTVMLVNLIVSINA